MQVGGCGDRCVAGWTTSQHGIRIALPVLSVLSQRGKNVTDDTSPSTNSKHTHTHTHTRAHTHTHIHTHQSHTHTHTCTTHLAMTSNIPHSHVTIYYWMDSIPLFSLSSPSPMDSGHGESPTSVSSQARLGRVCQQRVWCAVHSLFPSEAEWTADELQRLAVAV